MAAMTPNIATWLLPEAEREYADIAVSSARHLSMYAGQVRSALSLYNYALTIEREAARERRPEAWWTLIAQRDAAMQICQFGNSLEALPHQIGKAPSLSRLIDLGAIDEAIAFFQKGFPDFKLVRHAAAHSADHSRTPERLAKNSVKSQNSSLYIRDMSSGSSYSATIEGKLVSFSLDENCCSMLDMTVDAIGTCFHSGEEKQRLRFSELSAKRTASDAIAIMIANN